MFLDLVHGFWKTNISQTLKPRMTYNVTGFKRKIRDEYEEKLPICPTKKFYACHSAGIDITIMTGENYI